jgi:sulfatase modifying factor 1
VGHDVFISHSTKDKAAADAVCAALETNGVRCWIAPRNIKPGEKWATSILRGIAECRMMVLVFSEHANGSEHIQREVERAVHRGIPIAPLRVQEVMPKDDLEYFLSSSHWMDALTPPLENHLREFTLKVRGLLEIGGEPPGAAPDLSAAVAERQGRSTAPPSGRRGRLPLLLALTVSLLAGVAVTAWVFRGELFRRVADATHSQPLERGSPETPVRVNTFGMRFTRVEPGEFLMGSPAGEEGHGADETQHKVKLTKPFFMGTHLVTRGHFAAFVKDAAYRTDAEKEGWAYAYDGTTFDKVSGASWLKPGFDQTDDHPVIEVSWNDAQAFCQWLSKKEGNKYRLPSEAEWEYACRAGTHAAYFWGDSPDGGWGFANCADLTARDKFNWEGVFNWRDGFYTSPVGSFKPNPWGLNDMIGNALEWCADYYGPFGDGDAVDPTGPAQGDISSSRVLRGGSWAGHPRACRAAFRIRDAPDHRVSNLGFRVCLDF